MIVIKIGQNSKCRLIKRSLRSKSAQNYGFRCVFQIDDRRAEGRVAE